MVTIEKLYLKFKRYAINENKNLKYFDTKPINLKKSWILVAHFIGLQNNYK